MKRNQTCKTLIWVLAMCSLARAKMVTIRGDRNNTDEAGNFKHPFLKQSEQEVEVTTINYPDLGAFSVKL